MMLAMERSLGLDPTSTPVRAWPFALQAAPTKLSLLNLRDSPQSINDNFIKAASW